MAIEEKLVLSTYFFSYAKERFVIWVLSVRRLCRKEKIQSKNTLIPTNSVLTKFHVQFLPRSISFMHVSFLVLPYVPRVLMCYSCLRQRQIYQYTALENVSYSETRSKLGLTSRLSSSYSRIPFTQHNFPLLSTSPFSRPPSTLFQLGRYTRIGTLIPKRFSVPFLNSIHRIARWHAHLPPTYTTGTTSIIIPMPLTILRKTPSDARPPFLLLATRASATASPPHSFYARNIRISFSPQ
ncbi:hypothetical protein ALC57_18690 [Trachymyrmex cornetzi]|uniref:Uncharacterized protein n=1 Tax=Trachymyrmex cornetzi TaxID=471704 RepID=A0A151IRB4_9HYME|nr:hypothetical protein ALC57_18690 [Trachymyrmex cornetzi]